MVNSLINKKGGLGGASTDDFFAIERILLSTVKKYTVLEPHKNYCTLKIQREIYDYFLGRIKQIDTVRKRAVWENIANIVFLFVHFSNSKAVVGDFTEKDLSIILGVGERTIQNYIRMSKNHFFNVLSSDNTSSYWRLRKGKGKVIFPNKYMLLMKNSFGEPDNIPEITTKNNWVKIKIVYKQLSYKDGFIKKYIDVNSVILDDKDTGILYINLGRNEIAQNTDKQINKQVFFEHFHNPIYEQDFDEENTPHPVNWCRHPDPNALFNKGRWYGSAILGTKKGKQREAYLKYIGLTREIDMHNAMFYFMLALFPDSISKEDKDVYFELVKFGRLYDDAVDMLSTDLGKSSSFAADSLKGIVVGPTREWVKDRFQKYRNRKGKFKTRIKDIDFYYQEKFPTIRNWMLSEKKHMQNRLAWIETDFMSLVCEKLSDEHIRFDWLHDAVFVSETDYDKAQEIWDSVRDEFEAVFV